MKKHLWEGVKKGAFTEEDAENKFQVWLEEKAEKVSAKEEGLAQTKADAKSKVLEVEKAVSEARISAGQPEPEVEAESVAEAEAPETTEETKEEAAE